MTELKQGEVYLTVQTSLGEDVLVLSEFSAREQISGLFECDLVMVADRNDISLEGLTGQTARVGIEIQKIKDDRPGKKPKTKTSLMQRVKRGLSGQGLKEITGSKPVSYPKGSLSFGWFSSFKGSGDGDSGGGGGGLTKSLGGGLSKVLNSETFSKVSSKVVDFAGSKMGGLSSDTQNEGASGYGAMLGKLTSQLGGDSDQESNGGGLISKLGGALSGKLGGGETGKQGGMTGQPQGGGFGSSVGGDSGGSGTGSGGITHQLLTGLSKRFGNDDDAAPVGGLLSGLSGKLIDKARGNAFLENVMDRLGGEEAVRAKAQELIGKLDEGQIESGLKKIIEGDEETPGLLERGQEILGRFISRIRTKPGTGDLIGGGGTGNLGTSEGPSIEEALEKGPKERRAGFGQTAFPQTDPIKRDLSKKYRHFHGIIGEITQGPTDLGEYSNLTVYRAKLYPKLWLLTFSRNCRIFQKKTALEIIATILEENEITDVLNKVQSAGQSVREYCVQYNESNFDFISRLMEEEGIFYYFIHTEDAHTLILADAAQAHHQCPHTKKAILEKSRGQEHFFNAIQECDISHRAVPSEHALTDYDFELPSNNLHTTSQGKGIGGRMYGYPGGYDNKYDGQEVSDKRIEADEFSRDILYAKSTVPFLEPGGYFELSGHSRSDANKQYVVHKIEHSARHDFGEGEALYSNKFSGFAFSSVPFRPPLNTPRPRIPGTQTARVTGKEGEEIWTDEYGRIKVKFHWDENEADDETTSCWIRVAQTWAGNGWGSLFTPRIGQEVVVSFLEGDPDRPLITGSVYNGEKRVPYLPDNPTVSTIRSHSSKEAEGFNEIRFQDLADEEQVYIHAQKDMDVEIENNLSTVVHDGDETRIIETGSRTVELLAKDKDEIEGTGNDTLILDKGSRTVVLKSEGEESADHTTQLVDGDHTLVIDKGNQNVVLKEGDQNSSITGNRNTEITENLMQSIGKDANIKIEGNLVIDVTGSIMMRGKSYMLEVVEDAGVVAGKDISLSAINVATAGQKDITANAGMNFSAHGGMAATVSSDGSTSVSASGITKVNGSLVKINSPEPPPPEEVEEVAEEAEEEGEEEEEKEKSFLAQTGLFSEETLETLEQVQEVVQPLAEAALEEYAGISFKGEEGEGVSGGVGGSVGGGEGEKKEGGFFSQTGLFSPETAATLEKVQGVVQPLAEQAWAKYKGGSLEGEEE